MEITENTVLSKVFSFPNMQAAERYTFYSYGEILSSRLREATSAQLGRGNAKKIISVQHTLQRLAAIGESGKQFVYPVYNDAACNDDPQKRDVVLMHFPVEQCSPFVFIVSGGGFESVCSIGEGFPVATRLNQLGYHAFALNYRISTSDAPLFPKPIDDLAAAVTYIQTHATNFNVLPDHYIVMGFSAGGCITCQFGTANHGYAHYRLHKPDLLVPVYPLVYRELRDDFTRRHAEKQFGKGFPLSVLSEYNTLLHTDGFPPAYIVHTKSDTTVPYRQSVDLFQKLAPQGIPCRLDLTEQGEHGFGDGSGTDAEGWIDRAMKFYNDLYPAERQA